MVDLVDFLTVSQGVVVIIVLVVVTDVLLADVRVSETLVVKEVADGEVREVGAIDLELI